MVFQLESSNELLDLGVDCKKRFFYQNLKNGTLIQESCNEILTKLKCYLV